MGNEMGNNNVTGQQVSEETAQGFDRTIDHLDGSPSLNNTNDKGKDGTKDLDKSKLSKDPVITNGGNEQMVSFKRNSSIKNKDLDDKNRGSPQDHSLTQDDDQSCHLPSTRDGEPLNNKETETATNLPETTAPVSTAIEDTTSNKDSSTLIEKIKLVHETTERSEDINIACSQPLLKGNMEGTLEDEVSEDEVSGMGHDLIGEDKVENLDQGQTGVSTVEDPLMPMQGGYTSSIETITTAYLDTDDSDIKEVVIEDEPTGRGNSSYVQPTEIFKNDRARIPEEKEDISEISQRATVESGIGSCEVIDENKNHGLKDQDKDTCGALGIGQIVSKFQSSLTDTSATDVIELEKHELNKRGDDVAGEISDSLTGTEEQNVIERTHTEQEQGAKDAAVKDPADHSHEKESDSTHDVVSLVEVNGEDFTSLDSFMSYQLHIVNEENVHTEVREGLFKPSSPHHLIEDFHKRDLKVDGPHNYEETTISTYEVKTTDIQDTLAASQFDKPQQMLLEEPEVVKFENGGILSSCMQLMENSSKTSTFFPHGSKHEKDKASTTAIGFTSESNLEKVMVKVDFPAESYQKKIIANNNKASQEGYLLQVPAPRRDACEETPLLQMVENPSSFSFSNEQHSKVVECIPTASISLMQVKDDGDEEYEKSPLLSPREQEGENFIVPNHSVRNKKPLESLMTGECVAMKSPLKEQEPVSNNNTMVSSPRSTRKQKAKSSLFASCMCCATATN